MLNIRLDFEGETYAFTDAVTILRAESLTEVAAVFREVMMWQQKGYYVAGFVSYEAAPAFNRALQTHNKQDGLPLVLFGVFSRKQENSNEEIHGARLFHFSPDITYSDYAQKIAKIHEEIRQGNTYQTNYTIRLNSPILGEMTNSQTYEQLLAKSAVKYGAFIDTEDYQILSASPELFFKVAQQKIETRPMKGTIVRSDDVVEDAANAQFLASDAKNRAENMMIVDLLRNDLGQIAVPGSVKVEKLCEVEPYPTVWQMTSTITAELLAEKYLWDIFTALFPCGSITGAPKKSTMDLIHELETSPRGIYCGTIGLIKPSGEMLFNIPIRTVQVDKKTRTARYGVGGGIVWDSSAQEEFAEIAAKSRVLADTFPTLSLIECLRLENGTLHRSAAHLQRLQTSAQMFNVPINIEKIAENWLNIARTYPQGIYKFRYVLSLDGNEEITVTPLDEWALPLQARLAPHAITDSMLLAHKTNQRSLYETCRHPLSFETILWNERGELTECINGNLALALDGVLYTPPLSSGVLPGIMRETLLANGQLTERVLYANDLKNATNIYFMNSVRGLLPLEYMTDKR